MEDMLTHLEKLRTDAAECVMISNKAANQDKRDLFAKLAQHLTVLADEVQHEIDRKIANPGLGGTPQ